MGGRPSLLPSTPSSRLPAAGIPLLDAIHPDARGSVPSTPTHRRGATRVLILGAVMTVAVGAGWVVATRSPPDAPPVAHTTPSPIGPTAAAPHATAALPTPAAPASQAAQILPMAVAMAPAPSGALSAQSLAAESLADREQDSGIQAPRNSPAAAKPAAGSPPGKKKTSGHAKRAAPEPAAPPHKTAKSSKARTRPTADPDADVVAAIMASMDRRPAAAAPGKAASATPPR